MKIINYINKNLSLLKRILKIVTPTVIDIFTQILLIAIDMMMIGRIGADAITAIGLGSAPYNTILPALLAVGIGTSALVSRAYGAKKYDEINNSVIQSLFITIPLSLILVVIFYFFSLDIVKIIGRSEDLNLFLAKEYLDTTSISIFFVGVNIVFLNAYRAINKTHLPMIANVISLIVNTSLNYIFIFILNMGVFGAGIGTTISRLLVTLIFLYLAFVRQKYLIRLKLKEFKFDRFLSRRIFKVGIPAAFEQLALRGGMLIFEMMIISLGTINYAAHKIALTAESFSFNFGFAFSIAATALVGQELGKNDHHGAEKNAYVCTALCLIIMSFMGLIFFIFPQILISFFTKDIEVKKLAIDALKIVSICQPFLAVSMVLSGALRGAGATKTVLLITFLGIFLVRIPTTYFFLNILKTGLLGAWVVMSIDLSFRCLISFWVFKKGKWRYLEV